MPSTKRARRKSPNPIKKLRVRLTYISTRLSQTEIGKMSGVAQGTISYLTERQGISRSKPLKENLMTIMRLWEKEIPPRWDSDAVNFSDLLNAIHMDLVRRGLPMKPAPANEATAAMPASPPAA